MEGVKNMGLISQNEIVRKYGQKQSVVSVALKSANVLPVETRLEQGKWKHTPVGLYKENEAVGALIKMFNLKRMNLIHKASEYAALMESLQDIYKGGKEK